MIKAQKPDWRRLAQANDRSRSIEIIKAKAAIWSESKVRVIGLPNADHWIAKARSTIRCQQQ